MPEALLLLQTVVTLLPELEGALPAFEKLLGGETLDAGEVATIIAARQALEAKAFPPAA